MPAEQFRIHILGLQMPVSLIEMPVSHFQKPIK